jgi:hypothetical protein
VAHQTLDKIPGEEETRKPVSRLIAHMTWQWQTSTWDNPPLPPIPNKAELPLTWIYELLYTVDRKIGSRYSYLMPIMTTTLPLQEQIPERDTRGRFAKGNRGGPGNPFARQVAKLRQVLLNSVTVGDMTAIANKLIALAKDGNVQAIKLLFSYTLGKPAEAVEPDQLDVQEWDLHKQTAGMMTELPDVVAAPDPSLPLTVARAARPAVAKELGQQLGRTLQPPAERETDSKRERPAQREPRRPAAPDGDPVPPHRAHQGPSLAQASAADPEVDRSLQTLAQRDDQVLSERGDHAPENQTTDRVVADESPPSPNGCNGTIDSCTQDLCRCLAPPAVSKPV